MNDQMSPLSCPSPMCDGYIYIDPDDSIPSTYGDACSPECGNFVAGIIYALGDECDVAKACKAVAMVRENAIKAHEQKITEAKAFCKQNGHNLGPMQTFTYRLLAPGGSQIKSYEGQECSHCHSLIKAEGTKEAMFI